MKIRKIICIVFAFVFFSALFVSVKAHSGKTDSNGGHYDHKNGGYHYHHGYPAHSHYDMDGDGDRDCPYTYKKAPTTTTKIETDFDFEDIFIFLGKIVLASLFSLMCSFSLSTLSPIIIGFIVKEKEKMWKIVKRFFVVVFVAFFIIIIVADLCGKADIIDFFV